jgi:anti-sigma factor RsiW
MSCTEPRELLHAYLDRELDLAGSLEMERHLRECATCSQAYEAQRRLRTEIATDQHYFKAPPALRKRIRKAVRSEARDDWAFPWRWLSLAAPVALAAVLALSFLPRLGQPGASDLLVDDIVSGHVRSLMVNHLTDVASTDQHTVKPWFDGKLDFAPAVVNLADHGFPLVGGRLDYLGSRPVAALVYGRQRHFINLFVWPAAAGTGGPDRTLTRHGFNLIHWSASGMTYWVVSDLNPAELGEFAELVRQRAEAIPRPG